MYLHGMSIHMATGEASHEYSKFHKNYVAIAIDIATDKYYSRYCSGYISSGSMIYMYSVIMPSIIGRGCIHSLFVKLCRLEGDGKLEVVGMPGHSGFFQMTLSNAA